MPAIGPGTNNGSAGAATIDLRGLGPNRTLVLINGRRMVPFDLNGVVDTNAIPVSLINRVDLMTGAHRSYMERMPFQVWSISISRKNFRGLKLVHRQVYLVIAMQNETASISQMGAALDEGKVMWPWHWQDKSRSIHQAQRNWSKQGIASTTGIIQGSNTTVPSQITVERKWWYRHLGWSLAS